MKPHGSHWIRFGLLWIGILSFGWGNPGLAKIYKYQGPDGKWHYTDTPPEEKGVQEIQGGKTDGEAIGWDLDRHLNDKLRPRNPMEKARQFTVTLKTPIGLGSGFFINANGFIVTNRHLFEGDPNQTATAHRLYLLESERLGQFRERLIAYAADLIAYDGLGDDPALVRSLNDKDPDAFISLYRKIDRKDAAFKIHTERYEKLLSEYHERQEKLDALQEEIHAAQVRAENPPAYVTVFLADNTSFEAKFVAKSPDHDLALFQLSGYKTPFPEFGNVQRIPAGTPVYAVGSPLGLSQSISEGVFSALRQDARGAWILQNTAKVNQGNSGGPLIDAQGRVLAVNTAKWMRPGVEGISLSIAIPTVLEAFKSELR